MIVLLLLSYLDWLAMYGNPLHQERLEDIS